MDINEKDTILQEFQIFSNKDIPHMRRLVFLYLAHNLCEQDCV